MPRASMVGDWPLVGRDEELRLLGDVVRSRDRHGLVLVGPPGSGKTRLASEFLDEAERVGLTTARAAATRACGQLPFGAFASLLPAEPAGGLVAHRAVFLGRCCAEVARRAEGQRLVLLVDDAHLLDDSSAALTHQLAATGSAFVLVTMRSKAPAPDAIVALWKDGLAERLDLGALPAEDVEALLVNVLGGPVEPATVAGVVSRSLGNVLFVRELVLAALTSGALVEDGGIWRLVGNPPPSERLSELVEARLEGLSSAEAGLLEGVALGEPVGTVELTEIGDLGVAEALERRGLLATRMEGRRLQVRLAHPLYGEVLRARLPRLRALHVTTVLAEAVEKTGARRRDDSLRVGTWRLECGGGQPDLLLDAARTARWRFDFSLAERLTRAAVEAGAGDEAEVLLAQLALAQGRSDEAEQRLAVLASHVTDDALRASVAMTRMDNLMFWQGQVEAGMRVALEAEAAISEPTWRHEITAKRAGVLLATQGPRAAAEVAEPLRQQAGGRALAWACLVASIGLGRMGQLGLALEAADQGRQAHRTPDGPPLEWHETAHLVTRCDALCYAGRLREAEAAASGDYQRAVDQGSNEAQAYCAWALGRALGERGLVVSAARAWREAAAIFRQLGRPFHQRICLVYLTQVLALSSQPEAAAASLADIEALDMPPNHWVEADLLRSRACLAAASKDLAEARRLLGDATALAVGLGDKMGEAAALHDLARLGHPQAGAARLPELADCIEGDVVQVWAAHAAALAACDPPALEKASQAFEAMGAHLMAAEAAAEAATAWLRRGEPRTAAAAQRRSASLAARCEGAITPALWGVDTRNVLTRAEREVALLAASGRSNKIIAEQLHLSVRTVENRLQRVYEKLGVHNRKELVATLQD